MLTLDEMKLLLAEIAVRDGRTWAGDDDFDATAAAWTSDLDDSWLTLDLARQAVRAHYRADRRRITEADILDAARTIRESLLRRAVMPDPPAELLGDPAGWRAALDAAENAVLAGTDPAAAMTAVAARRRRELDGGRR